MLFSNQSYLIQFLQNFFQFQKISNVYFAFYRATLYKAMHLFNIFYLTRDIKNRTIT